MTAPHEAKARLREVAERLARDLDTWCSAFDERADHLEATLRAERAAAFREAAEVVADKRTYDITNARNHTGAQAAAVLRALAEKEAGHE